MAPKLQIRLFGTPSITLDGKPVTGFISNKSAAAVYYLAATNRTQARNLLATLLWTNSSEPYAKKNLRNVLSNLRDLLEPFLEITRDEVSFKVGMVDVVDSVRFATQLNAAAKLPVASQERNALLAETVALYQGPLLDGFSITNAEAFEEWALSEREHFHLLAMQAFNDLVVYSAQQGEFLSGIDYASRLLTLDPLREETYRNLMFMLALDGQTNAALAQYHTCQRILQTELGVEPDPETRKLYERIRAGEFSKSNPIALAPPVVRPHHNLPAELTSFVGRRAEMAQALARLQDPTCRLVTITGLGGVGKTRLALQIARSLATEGLVMTPVSNATRQGFLPEGVYFVPLAGLEASPELENVLAASIADSLQIPLAGDIAPAIQLIHALVDKNLLLVLDNFEHLIGATPFLVALLEKTRSLKLLVTSRVRLNLRSEQLISLDGLSTPGPDELVHAMVVDEAILNAYSATQLFVQRARVVLPDLVLSATTNAAIVRICHLVQGLPLGLELAAAWLRMLTCEEIASEIQRHLDFLDNSQTDTPIHQRGLRAVFNHSWRLLSPAEQQLLRQLAVFRGGFTRVAAGTVTTAPLALLAALIDKSLVRRSDPRPGLDATGDFSGRARYELPEVISQYAVEFLVQLGEYDTIATRHAAYYTDFLSAHYPHLLGGKQPEALRTIGAEIENIRAAWQWSTLHLEPDDVGLVRIARSLSPLFQFYDMRSWFQEGATLFAQTAARLAPWLKTDATANDAADYAIVHAKVQARWGWFAFHLGRHTESRTLLEESLVRLRAFNAEAESVFNLNYLGAVLRHLGEFAAAETRLQAGLALAQKYDDRLSASIALNTLGQLASLQGDLARAQTFCRQALTIKREIGDRWGMTYSLTYLGRVVQATGNYGAAQKLFEESLAICQEIGDQRGAAFALQNLADTAHLSGQFDAAQTHYQASLQIYYAIGSRAEASLTLARIGAVACAQGDYGLADRRLREALALAWSVQAIPSLLASVVGLAALAIATGQPEQAWPPLQLVYHHPASSQQQKQQAEQLMATLATAPSRPALATTLEAYVQMQLSDYR